MSRWFALAAVALSVPALGLALWATFHVRGQDEAFAGARIVTVDLVKVMNAERRALPNLGSGNTISLLSTGRALMPTIHKVAGKNVTVLVKQAVVGGHLPDITDKVLESLGLPTDAPTVSIGKGLSDTPTSGSLTAGDVWKNHLKQIGKQTEQGRKKLRKQNLERALP